MRKVLCLLIIFLLVGCSNSKLTCTKSIEDNGLLVEEVITIKFKKDLMNIVNLDIKSKATSDIIKENWSLFVDTVNNQYLNNNSQGIDIKTSSDMENYLHNILINMDINNVSRDVLEKYELEELLDLKDSNYSDIKNSLEIDGYVCK